MDPFDPLSLRSEQEERSYSSCLLQGLQGSSGSVPCFMTASSPIPFSEISAEFSIPDIVSEVERAPLTLTRGLRKAKVATERGGKYKCARCAKRFQTKGGRNLHLREHQPEVYLIKCPDCPFFTYQKTNFVKHAAIKHRKDAEGKAITANFQCPNCSYVCFTDEQLKLHSVRKHRKPEDKLYKCKECEYSTVEKAALEKHFAIVHKKEREFDCEICGFRSQTSSGLARHHRSHLETKPHQCHLCPMSYADKKRLREHLLKHSNVKQFNCSECKYATNRKDNLKTHIKRCHMPP